MIEGETQLLEGEQQFEDRSFSALAANVAALLIIGPVVVAAFAGFVALYGWQPLFDLVASTSLLVIVLVIAVGTLVHELLHVAGWRYAANPPPGTVRLGFAWRILTPYAHCSAPMTVRAYRIGAVAPGVLIGLLPLGVGLLMGNAAPFLFGLLFTLAAGGDALILWVLRDVAGDQIVRDHPTRAGCLVEITR